MPTLIQTINGTVTGLWGGSTMVRSADGKVRVLKLGDHVHKGDTILTTQDGIVQLAPDEQPATVAAKPTLLDTTDIDRVIAEVDNPTDETAPAAGLGGGGEGGLQEGLRVGRVTEPTSPVSFAQPNDGAPAANFEPITTAPATADTASEATPAAPTVGLTASAPTVTEGGTVVYTATVTQPVTGTPLVVTLTNGATITIPVGQTTGTSAPVTVRGDDA